MHNTNNSKLKCAECAECAHNDIIFTLDGSQSILDNPGMYDKVCLPHCSSAQYCSTQMTQLVNDILASGTSNPSVQSPVWANYVGGRGVHVGLIKFSDDVSWRL